VKFSYANTDFTLLGMVVEKVTGKEAVREIHRRILAPLGLKDIHLEGFEPVPQNRLPHRYHWATHLALYGVALRDGRLLKPQSMKFLTEWFPAGAGSKVRHNMFRHEYPGGLAIIGHYGDVLGFTGSLYWVEGTDAAPERDRWRSHRPLRMLANLKDFLPRRDLFKNRLKKFSAEFTFPPNRCRM
jgi:CubicO group peptidase (beta-lactamase class C family)